MMDVRLVHLPPVRVAAVHRRAAPHELSRLVPAGCGLVWNFLRAKQLRCGRHVAIYWDGAINLDVGVEITETFEPAGDVVVAATPAGPAAVAVHLGPYAQLGAAHQAIQRWCRSEGHRLAGPNWEIYGHWDATWDTDPSRIRTDVFYQLAVPPD